ncbi:MAG: hypothetical protein ACRDGS_10950, partial [Chloroflexota bacterium]
APMAMIGGFASRALGAAGDVLGRIPSGGSIGSGGAHAGAWPAAQRQAGGSASLVNRFATSAAIGQATAGATDRWISTANLVGSARASGTALASGPGAVMVSRMWSGQPIGGALTSDQTPGAAGPLGTPVPGLPEMTQRATAASSMMVFGGLTEGDAAPSRSWSGAAPTVQVSRAVALPPTMPALAPTSGPVVTQRSTASLAAPNGGSTTLAGRGMVVTPGVPVQREITVADTPSSVANAPVASESTVPTDIEALVDTVIMRLKRQLALDHERAGGFHTSLLR